MSGVVKFADWVVGWRLPFTGAQAGGGLIVYCCQYKGNMVLLEGSAPFALVPYDGSVVIKDGLSPNIQGVPYLPLKPTAPDLGIWNTPFSEIAATEADAVVVEKIVATHTEPAKAVVWCKLNVHNYQYVHRWEFHADDRIEVGIGVGGELLGTDTAPSFRKINHVHNFYVRLDFFNLGDSAGVIVEQQVQTGAVTAWQPVAVETKQSVIPSQYTRWRVRCASLTNLAGLARSYEIIPSSVDPPDGTNSTGDFWAINRKGAEMEMGAEVATEDNATDNHLAAGYGSGQPLGKEVIVWHVLRERHTVDPNGEDKTTVPYHFESFVIRPRDFLDDTPKSLYLTNPPSP